MQIFHHRHLIIHNNTFCLGNISTSSINIFSLSYIPSSLLPRIEEVTCTYCHSFHVLSACLLTITMSRPMYCHDFRGPDLFCPINVPESIAMSSYSVQVHEVSLFPLELCMHCYLLHVTLPMFMYCQSVI